MDTDIVIDRDRDIETESRYRHRRDTDVDADLAVGAGVAVAQMAAPWQLWQEAGLLCYGHWNLQTWWAQVLSIKADTLKEDKT